MTPAILLNGDIEVKARLWNFLWLAIGGIIIKVITGNVIEVRLYATKGGHGIYIYIYIYIERERERER